MKYSKRYAGSVRPPGNQPGLGYSGIGQEQVSPGGQPGGQSAPTSSQTVDSSQTGNMQKG